MVKITNIEHMWVAFTTREQFDTIYGQAEGEEMIQGYDCRSQVDKNWKGKPELDEEEIEIGFKLQIINQDKETEAAYDKLATGWVGTAHA